MKIDRDPVYKRRRQTLGGILSLAAATLLLPHCTDSLNGPECSKETIPITIDDDTSSVWEATNYIDGIESVDRQAVVSKVIDMNEHIVDVRKIAPGAVVIIPVSCDN